MAEWQQHRGARKGKFGSALAASAVALLAVSFGDIEPANAMAPSLLVCVAAVDPDSAGAVSGCSCSGTTLVASYDFGPSDTFADHPSCSAGSSSSSSMERIRHSSAGSLIRPGATRMSDRLSVSGLAWGNTTVQEGQAREEDGDCSAVGSTFGCGGVGGGNGSSILGYTPIPADSGFHRPFAAVDRQAQPASSGFSMVGGVQFDTPRFDGVTTDANFRSISVDGPFVDTEVSDFQTDAFITHSLASRLQVQVGLVNSYSHVEATGGSELDVYRSELYGGGFVGVLPWLWLDGSVGLGFAHFDANAAAGIGDETALLFSSSAGATAIVAHPDHPWAASGRLGVNFLHVGTTPDPVNQTKLDLSARIGRRMDWGPGGGAAYVGYIGSTALANAAVPGEDWTNLIEAGVIFALPDLGVLRLSGDVLVGDSDVENFSAKLTFHLFPNRG